MPKKVQRRYYHDILPYKRPAAHGLTQRKVLEQEPVQTEKKSVAKTIDGVVSSVHLKPSVPQKNLSAKKADLQGQAPQVTGMLIMDVVRHRKRQQASPTPIKTTKSVSESMQNLLQPQEVPRELAARVNKKRSIIWRVVPVGLAVMILLGGAGVFWVTLKTNKQVAAQVAGAEGVFGSEEGDAEPPDESDVPLAAVSGHLVSPDMPKTIEIKKLSVFSRVRRVGILKNGELAVPGNIFDSGWYEGSSKPGAGGAVLMVGHVHGPTKPGAFAGLKNLEKDDVITITRGDGKEFNYRVVTKEQVAKDKVDMVSALLPVTPGRQGLNIITCGGKYLPATQEYADRVVIYAEQI